MNISGRRLAPTMSPEDTAIPKEVGTLTQSKWTNREVCYHCWASVSYWLVSCSWKAEVVWAGLGVGGSLPHMLTNLYLLFPCPGFSCLASHGYSQTCQSALQALPQLDVAWQFPKDTTRRSNVCGQLKKAGLWKTGTETWRMECGKCLHPLVRIVVGSKDPLG